MEYGVYLESSAVSSLNQNVLSFLNRLVEKAKGFKDFAISFKKKEIAEEFNKDVRTINRYLNELEDKNIIMMKGVRGRSGGTVLMFNSDAIHFESSDRALVNSDKPINIEEYASKRFPKKPKKEPKRNRRSQKELAIAKALQNDKKAKEDILNAELDKLLTPNWEWFQKTEDPVGNYKTYLVTRMYNRFAALSVDRSNALEDYKLPYIKQEFDILGTPEFLGTSKWQSFERFRIYCDENGIDPAVYLSAQFGRSIFYATNKQLKRNFLPFPNALKSEACLEVYRQYCQIKSKSLTATFSKVIPVDFGSDFVVAALKDAYNTASEGMGFGQYQSWIDSFLEDESDQKNADMINFYRLTQDKIEKSDLTARQKFLVDKYTLVQIMIACGGKLPAHFVLGTEMVRGVIQKIKEENFDQAPRIITQVLGIIAHANATTDEQKKLGQQYLYSYNTLYETNAVIRLIHERKGLALPLNELRQAIQAFGKHNLPINEWSFLDEKQILDTMRNADNYVEVKEGPSQEDMEAITRKSDIDFYQYTQYDEMAKFDDFLSDALAEELNK